MMPRETTVLVEPDARPDAATPDEPSEETHSMPPPPKKTTTTTTASSVAAGGDAPVPFIYRLLLLYIEPVLAVQGAYLLFSSPAEFLSAVSPLHASISSSGTGTGAAGAAGAAGPGARVLADMLAAVYLVLAFNLAVGLRAAGRDRRMWRVLCSGMLISDVLHMAATVREFGGPARMARLDLWRPCDWFNVAVLVAMAAARAAVVAGVGMGGRGKAKPL